MLQLQDIEVAGHENPTACSVDEVLTGKIESGTIGALIIRIGFWGPLYDNYSEEPPR